MSISMRKGLSRGLASSTALKLSSVLCAVVLTAILARTLGPAGFGLYSYVFAIASLLGVFVQFGIPVLVMRETARAELDADWPRLKRVWQWSSRVVLLIAVGIVAVGAAVVWHMSDRLESAEIWTLAFGALLVPTMALGALRGAALRGLRHIAVGLLPEHVLRPVFFIILLLAGAYVFPQLSAPQAMGLHVVAAFLAFICGAYLLWHVMPAELGPATPLAGSQGWWRASLAFGLTMGMHQVNNYGDILILGLFRPAEEVAYYRVAYQVGFLVPFGLQIVGLVVSPHFARLAHRQDRHALQKLATSSARLSTLMAVLVIGILALWGAEILVLVFGPAYSASLPPLLILMGAHLVSALFGPVATLLNMSGHEREAAIWTGVSAACNLALNFLLIPSMGMEGAALATLLTFLILNLCLWHCARRILGVNVVALAGDFRLGARDEPRQRALETGTERHETPD